MPATETILKDPLVAACMRGDQSGYRQLYDQYARAMYNTSLRIVNNTADAEDILQEAFVDAFRSIRDFEYRSTFGAWLKRIVVNKSINLLRGKKLVVTQFDEQAEFNRHDEPVEEDEVELQIEAIRKAIKALPDGYRTVISLYLVEGYDQEEIAEIMGIAHTTVRTQYMRAKQRLLQVLKNMQHEI